MFVDMARVELPDPATDIGENVALVRFGKPLRAKLTGDENGPTRVTVTV